MGILALLLRGGLELLNEFNAPIIRGSVFVGQNLVARVFLIKIFGHSNLRVIS